MPNYPTHARWGRIGAVLSGLALGTTVYLLFDTVLIAGAGALAGALATFVGSIYPDIDHHSSVPRRRATRAFQLLVVVGVLSAGVAGWETLLLGVETAVAVAGTDLPTPPGLIAGVLSVVVASFGAVLVEPAIGVTTRKHRGWTHSVLINLSITAGIAVGVWGLMAGVPVARRLTAVGVVVAFLFGAFIHLGLDGELV